MGRPQKHGKVSPKTLDRRVKESGIMSSLISFCQESGLEMFETLGYLGRKFYMNKDYGNYDMKKGKMFNQIFNDTCLVENELPRDLALYLMVSMEIGEKKYTHLARTLSKYVTFPDKALVRERKREICPDLEDTFNQGKWAPLRPTIANKTKNTIEHLTDLTANDITPIIHTKWASGGDGSGRNSTFRSCKTDAGEDNHNYIFGGNRLISVKNDQGQVLYEEKSLSGKTELPHYLIPGKESTDLVEKIIE